MAQASPNARLTAAEWVAAPPHRAEKLCELPRRRVVEDKRGRQRLTVARHRLQLVPQLDRAERVDPRLHQRRVRIDRAARRAPHDAKHRLEPTLTGNAA